MTHTLTLTFQSSSQKTKECFDLNLPSLNLTVKELITYSVTNYISELRLNQHLSSVQCLETLNRKFLRDEEVRAQKAAGKVAMPEHQKELKIDNIHEVKKALKAFENQVYFLLVDGKQLDNLNEKVRLKDNSKIFFLRMVQLQGG